VTARRQYPERTAQGHIVRLLRSLGAAVYVLGTVRRRDDAHHGTMQTPGIPDLYAILPRRGGGTRQTLWVEVKAARGRRSPAQDTFAAHVATAPCDYVCGGLPDVVAYLARHGYVRVPEGGVGVETRPSQFEEVSA
jgi:hypothetical protein